MREILILILYVSIIAVALNYIIIYIIQLWTGKDKDEVSSILHNWINRKKIVNYILTLVIMRMFVRTSKALLEAEDITN